MTRPLKQSFGPREAKGWTPRDGAERPRSKSQRDLYAFAAKAREQGRTALANALSSLAENLPIIEGRCKLNANITLNGKGAAPLDSPHRGGGEGNEPPEIRAALLIADAADRVQAIVEDWA